MMDAAREASRNAYAPYSDFHVGAAILTEDGALHTGCNVENVSYGLTICAERNAAAGACRQVLREFSCKEVVVEEESGLRRYPFEEILPHSFGPEDL